jgi:hypothetical protein
MLSILASVLKCNTCSGRSALFCFNGKRQPMGLSAMEVEAFLTYLTGDGKVSASTQNQALSALLFL